MVMLGNGITSKTGMMFIYDGNIIIVYFRNTYNRQT